MSRHLNLKRIVRTKTNLLTLFLFILLRLILPQSALATSDEIFGAWSLVCSDDRQAKSNCTLSQVIAADPKGKKVLLGVSVSFSKTSKTPTVATLDFRMSSTANPKAGIVLKIDKHPAFKLPMSECLEHVCRASGFLVDPLLKQMREGQKAHIAFFLKNDKQKTFPFFLKGFKEAYAKLAKWSENH